MANIDYKIKSQYKEISTHGICAYCGRNTETVRKYTPTSGRLAGYQGQPFVAHTCKRCLGRLNYVEYDNPDLAQTFEQRLAICQGQRYKAQKSKVVKANPIFKVLAGPYKDLYATNEMMFDDPSCDEPKVRIGSASFSVNWLRRVQPILAVANGLGLDYAKIVAASFLQSNIISEDDHAAVISILESANV